MRIVYFAHSVLNRGGDKMVLAHLAHLADLGHEVVIRSNEIDTIFAIHPAITVERPRFGAKLGTLFSALVERQRAEMVIASIVPTAVLLGLRNHGRVLHFAQDDNETAYSGFLLRALMRSLYRLAFGVLALPTVTVSAPLAGAFRERFGAECTVVSNGVDTGTFFPSPSQELLPMKGERRAILVLSRSDPRKGFDLACQAVAKLAQNAGYPLEIWTIGDRPDGCPFPGIHRHFGQVDEVRLRELMSSADVFLYPSRYEGFGLMALEAFACRCPVVTTEAVAFARHGENALVAGIGDAASIAEQLREMLEDDRLAAALSERAFAYARAHSLTASSTEFALAVVAAAHR